MIKRLLSLPRSHSFFLFGPRGAGKSTLLKSHFGIKGEWAIEGHNHTLWIDLLSAETHYKLAQRPELLLDMWRVHKPKWIVIDEIQKNPALLDIAHKMIEEQKLHFALSGSSARKLKRGQANLLAGRAIALYLSPFCFVEVEKNFSLSRALKFGLLPRFWNQEKLSEKDTVRSLYTYSDMYLKEEVVQEQLVRKLDPFRIFLRVAGQANGSVINFSKVDRDAGLGTGQSRKYFEILSDTLLVFFLPPYHRSIRKRQDQRSKFYFFDTGVLRALQMLAGESLHPSTFEYGNLFETFIINEIFKMARALEKRWHFSYLRTQAGVELDLIVEKPKAEPILIEIKSSLRAKQEHLRPLKRLSEAFPNSQKYLWHSGEDSYVMEGIPCLPWHKGLKQLFELESV